MCRSRTFHNHWISKAILQIWVDCIKRKKAILKGLLAASFTPRLDERGVLRVGGRMENSLIEFDQELPIILPRMTIPLDQDEENWKTRSFTCKVLHQAHLDVMHGGVEHTWALVRARFHVPNGKNAVICLIHRCLICRKIKDVNLR